MTKKQVNADDLIAIILKAIDDVKIDKHIYINVIETYERIAEKGGKSIDIFKKIADANFFKEDFEKAAKWYTELFKITAELDPEYYERFAFALNSIGKKEKANEIKNKLNKRLND